jgi:hypothetical protein
MRSENLSTVDTECDETCDGVNPGTGPPCVLDRHRGFHEDERGAHWLSD